MSHIIKATNGKSYILKERSLEESKEHLEAACVLCCFYSKSSEPCLLNCYREARKVGLHGYRCYFEEVTEK